MVTLSEHPLIALEFTSETKRTLLFDESVIDADVEHFRQLSGDLFTQTAGKFFVKLKYLPYGELTICHNPTITGRKSLDNVVQEFCQHLREMCATCPDFKPQPDT